MNKMIKNIIIMTRGEAVETWGSLSEVCRVHGYKYNTLIKKKFPFNHDGWKFQKVPFREKSNQYESNNK